MNSLAHILRLDTFATMVPDRVFRRGVDLFVTHAVSNLVCGPASLRARVLGSEPYNVRLWVRESSLAFSCSCPMGEEGECCKHVVAAALAATRSDLREPFVSRRAEPAP